MILSFPSASFKCIDNSLSMIHVVGLTAACLNYEFNCSHALVIEAAWKIFRAVAKMALLS